MANYLKYLVMLFAVTLCFTSGCGQIHSDDGVVIAGSTSVQPYVEILAEDYALHYPQHIIDVQGGGSSAGIQAVVSGTADIGMSSRRLSGDETGLWSQEIAIDGLAIITHPDNPVKNLTLEQLRGIYTAEYTNWGQLGGDDTDIYIITREEGSGTRSAFEDMVMGEKRITPKAIVQDSNGAVRQLVSDAPAFIGYISLGLVELGEKEVSAVNINGVKPTKENIQNGSYTLYRAFLFIAQEEPSGIALQFIDYIFSPNGQAVLENEGLIPGTRH